MSKAPYTPRPDSLPAKVMAFFAANPEEELTLEDIAEKFSTPRNNIHTNLGLAVDAGLLKRARNADGEYIYLVTRKPAKPAPPRPNGIDMDAVHLVARKPQMAARGGFQAPRIDIDIDALQVETGIPYTKGGNHAGSNKWTPLFAKLTKAGQSIAVPRHARGAVGAAAAKVNKLKVHGTFRVAMTGADTARVWRVA